MKRSLNAVAVLLLAGMISWQVSCSGSSDSPTSPANTPTYTPTLVPSATPTSSPTDTATTTPSASPTNTGTSTPTATPTSSPTVTCTATPSNSPTNTSTPTPSSTPTNTPTNTATSTPYTYSAVVTFGGGTLAAPLGIAYASGGYLWVTDFTNATLSKWTTAGAAVTSFSTFNSGTMSFSDIFQVAIDPATGNLYVCERVKSHIDVFDPTGVYLTNFGSAQFSSGPTGVAINSSGTTVYGADQGNNRCYAYSISGTPSSPVFTYRFTFANSDGVANTQLMNMDSNDHVWFADATNSLLLEYDATGVHQRTVTQTGYGFTAGALDGQGNIFAVSDGPNILFEYNQANAPVTQYSNGFNNPYGMTFNDTKDYFYVTNFGAGNVVGFKRN